MYTNEYVRGQYKYYYTCDMYNNIVVNYVCTLEIYDPALQRKKYYIIWLKNNNIYSN